MQLKWMGKYRAYVEAMVRYGNAYAQAINVPGVIEDPPINSAELQVMEYIYENEERHDNMSQIASRLRISQSRFSKVVSQLVKKGLLEKYHTKNNRKDVIIQLTDHAKELYKEYATGPRTEVWREAFKVLDKMSKKDVELLIKTLDIHTSYLYDNLRTMQENAEELVPIAK